MYTIKQKEHEITNIVRKNIQMLMDEHGLTLSNFCKYIENQNKPSIHRTTFSKFMNEDVHNINLAFLVSCSQAFELSLDNLIREDFNPRENFQRIEEKYRDIPKKKHDFEPFYFNHSSNEIFIENPNSPLLKKYVQLYHCYYYSTVSAENNTNNVEEALISGTLNIEADGINCKATLKIDTKTADENGNRQYKIYSGKVILCPSIQSVHCILTLPKGEFCFIIFRYSHLNFNKQQCRLAEVLSTSSIPDKRYPIVHRMLLSNEEIKEDDFKTIAPHLCLNSSDIFISESELSSLAETSEDYKQIVQQILKNEPEMMYRIKETTIKEISEKFLAPEELDIFITQLRSHSFAKRYNKVSPKADTLIRNTLLQKGYFQKDSVNSLYTL